MPENNVNPSEYKPGQVGAKAPHSADLPDDQGREAPPRPYDVGGNNDLADATAEYRLTPDGMPGNVAEGLSKAPLTDDELEQLRQLQERANLAQSGNDSRLAPDASMVKIEDVPATETKGHGPKWLRRALVGATGLAAAITATVVATNDDKEAAPSFPTSSTSAPQNVTPSPSTGESVVPSANTSPSPTKSEVVVTKTDAERIAELRTMKIADYNKLLQSERLKPVVDQFYRVYNGDYSYFFGQKFVDKVGPGKNITSGVYEYNPLYEVTGASELNTDQMILNQLFFQEQTIKVQKMKAGVDGMGELNINQANQMISGLSYYVGDEHPELTKNTYQLFAWDVKSIQETTGMTEPIDVKTRGVAINKGVTQLKSGVDADGKSIVYKDIMYKKPSGIYETRVALVEAPTVMLKDLEDKLVPVQGKMWLEYTTAKVSSQPQ